MTEITAEPGTHELRYARIFDAPRELVFRAHTEPELLARWWGERGDETIVDRLEPRPGGGWRILSRTADGEDGFHGYFHEVTPERIVQTFEYEGAPGHVQLETLLLEDLGGGKTRLTGSTVFQSVADRDAMAAGGGMETGWSQSMDRLAELLGTL